MRYKIRPSSLQGEITIPSSKSHTHRAILFGMLGKKKSTIHQPLISPDTLGMIEAARLFGAKVNLSQNTLEIEGGSLHPCEDVINAGNSGIVLRFMAAISALFPSYCVITGDHSIRHQRPVAPLLNALKQLGAFATSTRLDGFAPIIIRGPLHAGTTELSGEDSQPVSALLIATAFSSGPSQINVKNPGEKPWIDLTLSWFDRLGIAYENRNYEQYLIPGHAKVDHFEWTMPGDFSSAAFPLAASLVTGSEITLHNIDMSDVQGDKKFISILQEMGAEIEINSSKRSLTLKKGKSLKGITVDINDCIDTITTLAVIGCFAEGETKIINAKIARTKECDRIHAITTELKKMGADIEEFDDGLLVKKSALKGAHLKTYHDHRMVMSLSVAALGAQGESLIEGVEAVSKTYPDFAQAIQDLQGNLKVIP